MLLRPNNFGPREHAQKSVYEYHNDPDCSSLPEELHAIFLVSLASNLKHRVTVLWL